MKKVLIAVALMVMVATTAHAKKLEDVTLQGTADTVENVIAGSPATIGRVIGKTIVIVGKVIKFPFQQLEGFADQGEE